MAHYDIVFISYDEPNKESNWKSLKKRFPQAMRVDSIKGIREAHNVAAELVATSMFYVVDGDNEVLDSFNFDYKPEDENSIYVWRARNPLNGLEYGFGAIKLLPKRIFNKLDEDYIDNTTSYNVPYKIINLCASITRFNTDPFQTYRSAFRECVKLASKSISGQKEKETEERLNAWKKVVAAEAFAEFGLRGAEEGAQYGLDNRHSKTQLAKINDFDWLKKTFKLSCKLNDLKERDRLLPDQISDTFCVLPWIHLSTRPNGHMRLCCTANASSAGATNDKKWGGEVGILKQDNGKPSNLNVSSLLDSWNNDYMKNARRMMLSNEVPASCTKCFKEESSGYRSKRNWETEYWRRRINLSSLIKDTKPDGSIPEKVYYVDLRMGTKCNLKCIMCSPHDSSMWVGDWKKLYPQIENPSLKQVMIWDNHGKVDGASYDWHKDNEVFWKQLYSQIPHMKQLYFAGGESTIIKEHYDLLEACVEQGYANNIELRYNSNGIELPEKLFKLWNEFKSVRFHFSLDSINEMNNYIRYPSDWNQIKKNLIKLDNTPENIEVTIACAVQALNIYYLPDFIKWKISQNFKKINKFPFGAGLLNFHFVYHPAHLNVKVLPEWFKKRVENKFEDFYDWLVKNYRDDKEFLDDNYGIKRLQGMVRFMNSEDWSRRLPELEEYISRMDNIRKTSFSETFPEMKDIFLPRPLAYSDVKKDSFFSKFANFFS